MEAQSQNKIKYILKRVPKKGPDFREDIENDVFLQCFFEDMMPREWDAKNTDYWIKDNDWSIQPNMATKIDTIKDARKCQKYARFVNMKINDSYIGILQVEVDSDNDLVGFKTRHNYEEVT